MIDKNDLLEWLRAADKKLKKKIVLIAVGGTAMTLLGLKSSTRDVDFCIKSEDKKDFEKALATLKFPPRAFIKEPIFDDLKKVFGKDVEVLLSY